MLRYGFWERNGAYWGRERPKGRGVWVRERPRGRGVSMAEPHLYLRGAVEHGQGTAPVGLVSLVPHGANPANTPPAAGPEMPPPRACRRGRRRRRRGRGRGRRRRRRRRVSTCCSWLKCSFRGRALPVAVVFPLAVDALVRAATQFFAHRAAPDKHVRPVLFAHFFNAFAAENKRTLGGQEENEEEVSCVSNVFETDGFVMCHRP